MVLNICKTLTAVILLCLVPHAPAQTARDLHNRAEQHSKHGEYPLADSLFSESLARRKALGDTLSVEYAETLHARGLANFYQNNQSQAALLLQQVARIRRQILGTTHPDYVKTFLFQAASIVHAGNLKEGERQLAEASRLIAHATGNRPWLQSRYLYYKAMLYLFKRDFTTAETYYLSALENEGKYVGKNTIHYACCLNCIALARLQLSRPDGVEELLLKALDIYRQNGLENHRDNLAMYTNLGGLYTMSSQYHRAVHVLPGVLLSIEQMLGKEHEYYVNSLNLLAISYQYMGLNEQAEAAYIESLELRQKMYGEESRQVIQLCGNMAQFYSGIGNHEASIGLYKKAEAAAQKHNYNDLLGRIYGGWAQNLVAEQQPVEAFEYFNKALDMQEKHVGTDNPTYIAMMAELIKLKGEYMKEEEDGEALMLLLNLKENHYGRSSTQYATMLNTIGMFHYNFERYTEAANYFRQAIDILPRLKGHKNDRLKHSIYYNLAQCYERQNNPQQAIAFCLESIEAVKNETKSTFAFLSEKQREAFLHSRSRTIQQCKSILMNYKDTHPEVALWLYNNELFYKNLLLSSGIQIQRAIQAAGNDTLTTRWNELRTLKDRLPRIDREKIAATYIDSIENHCQQLEKLLVKESKAYREEQSLYHLNWKDIKKQLAKDQFMVDYIWTPDRYGIEITYAALVLGANFERPIIVPCCKEPELRAAIASGHADSLYRLVWEPVAKTIGPNVSEVCIVPTRMLYQVSFNGLKDPHSVYLIDKHPVRNMLSARSLPGFAEQKSEEQSAQSIVLFGGADYDLSLPDYLALHPGSGELKRGQGFHYLPGSRAEVGTIGSILSAPEWEVTIHTDTDATEARLKSYSGLSPDVLHISTHGFYSPGNEDTGNTDSPLLRTGLVFTGANITWNNRTEVLTEEVEDGILSAYEVANLDLSNTKLVVLSACNTGKGDLRVGSEGLYGLQRAFHLAGVQSLIISLWEISDADTVTFMSEFYQEWNNGHTPAKAFGLAQKKMRTLFPEDADKWSAFVFIE